MAWRPDDWEDLKLKAIIDTINLRGHKVGEAVWIEAGAEAILEALKHKGTFMLPEQMRVLAPDRKHPYGWLVFIPQEVSDATR